MKKALIFLALLTFVFLSCSKNLPQSNTSTGNDSTYNSPITLDKVIPGRVIVQMDPSQTKSAEGFSTANLKLQLTRNASLNITAAERIISDDAITTFSTMSLTRSSSKSTNSDLMKNLFLIHFDSASKEETASTIETLRNDPQVIYAEPDYRLQAVQTPNDPDLSKLWGMTRIQAPLAWDIQTGSTEVIVAVIDTGVKYNHPDLADNILKDAQGNVIGYDFANSDADPMDDNGHGTHCSGTIGAKGNNSVGVPGVNWNVKIMPLKFLGTDGGTTTDAIKAIDYAIAHNADIMSNSWGGGGYSEALKEAIQRAQTAGILFVVAAGNDGSNNDTTPTYPANYSLPNMITVASTAWDGSKETLSSFSNYGKTVDLAAPGSNIYSTWNDGSYKSISGTSMATPHVSGVAALVKAQHPDWDYAQIKEKILASVDKIDSLTTAGCTISSGWWSTTKCEVKTGGRLNAFKALESDDEISPTVSISSPANNSSVAESITITANATDNIKVTKVVFSLVPGATLCVDTTAPFSCAWDTHNVANGQYTLTASAFDAAGNEGFASPVIINVNNEIDTQVPVVAITSPANNSTISGTVTVSANATDNKGISKVEFYINGFLANTDTTAPYSFSLNTLELSNQIHSFTAKAYDTSGNFSVSPEVKAQIENIDTELPSVAITSPANNSSVGLGEKTITINATDNMGVAQVELFINDSLVTTLTTAPYSFSYNFSAPGSYTIKAIAKDLSGNQSQAIISLSVNAFTCQDWYTSNYDHILSGRAHKGGSWNMYAVTNGSEEVLGLNNMFYKSWVKETATGYYEMGECAN